MLRLIAVASASIRAAAWRHQTLSRQHTRRQADLYGGQDTQRNEDIEALKRAFYGGGSEDTFATPRRATRAARRDGQRVRVDQGRAVM